MGADNAHGQALLAGDEQRLVHLVEGLVEGLDLVDALVARQVAPAAARVQKPLPLIQIVLIPGICTQQPGSFEFSKVSFQDGDMAAFACTDPQGHSANNCIGLLKVSFKQNFCCLQ